MNVIAVCSSPGFKYMECHAKGLVRMGAKSAFAPYDI